MGRKRRRKNRCFWGTLLGLLGVAVAYVLIVASVQAATSPYHFHDLLIPRAVDCLVVAWLFWVGSAVGSFLNVVAWRMPRGQSINGFSHCPRCNHRLSARDNWPVFGWLALRGRCRTCRLPISPRYPIVELAVGLTILCVGYIELYCGQWNLPDPERVYRSFGPMSMPDLSRENISVCIYHIVAIASSWALGLVRFDNQKLPRSLVTFVLLAAALPMLFWPPVMQVSWQATSTLNRNDWSLLDAVMRVITGLVGAALIARSMGRYVCPTADLKLDPMGKGTKRLVDLVVMLMVPGIIIGWQALLGVVILTCLTATIMRGRSRITDDGLAWFSVILPIMFAVQLCLWRPLEAIIYWPSSQSPPWVILVAAAVALFAPIGLRKQNPATVVDLVKDPRSQEEDL